MPCVAGLTRVGAPPADVQNRRTKSCPCPSSKSGLEWPPADQEQASYITSRSEEISHLFLEKQNTAKGSMALDLSSCMSSSSCCRSPGRPPPPAAELGPPPRPAPAKRMWEVHSRDAVKGEDWRTQSSHRGSFCYKACAEAAHQSSRAQLHTPG